MNKVKSIDKRMMMMSLTWPIFIETSIRMFFLSLDTLMLSAYSDKAVAAVGLISQFMFFVIIVYQMVGAGTGIVLTQYLGGNKAKEARDTIAGSIILMFAFSLVLSIGLRIGSTSIVGLFDLEKEVYNFALDYFSVFSLYSISFAMNILFGSIFRSYGRTKEPMIVNMLAMGLNALGNYCFIYGKFGMPELGVKGVAISSVVSQGLGALVLLILLKKYKLPVEFKMFNKIPGNIYKNILKIGVPNGFEILSYNIAQIVMLSFISQMGTNSLAAYSYSLTIQRSVFVFSISIGNATQILVSYLVGSKQNERAYKTVYRNFYTSFTISIVASSIVAMLRYPIIDFFTDNNDVAKIAAKLLAFAIVLEAGRTFNLVIINGLKGAGDVKFPVYIGVLSMWGLGVGLSYLLGIHYAIGILGVWIAIASDEWMRGIVMFFRWRSKKWIGKSIIIDDNEAAA